MKYREMSLALKRLSSSSRALGAAKFFKTGKGEYGEGDVFIGVTVPDTRTVAKTFAGAPLAELGKLLKSKIHDERLLALIIMVNQWLKSDPEKQEKLTQFYLRHRRYVNNWDLVDTSAPTLLGLYCFHKKDASLLEDLLRSKHHWDRRMAILGTFSFTRNKHPRLTFSFASKLLSDREDLMHKATGWMLREAGKKDLAGLKNFLQKFGKRMPRTMLRYAIEKIPPAERKRILLETKPAAAS